MLRKLKRQIQKLRTAQEGVAAVEFAIILPFMLALFMGSIEISQLIIVDRKVSNIAGVMGDLVAQSEDSISTATLNDYFDASDHIIAPYDKTLLKQVITSVFLDAQGDATVHWSHAHNGAVAHIDDASFTLPDSIEAVATNTYFIVAETTYAYDPIFGYTQNSVINLSESFVFYPRFGTKIDFN